MRKLNIAVVLTALGVLAGCSTTGMSSVGVRPIGGPAQPVMRVGQVGQVQEALKCMADAGTFKNFRVAVTPWADGTGKGNSVALGSTGNFLPGGTTASFVSEALRTAGVDTLDFYSWAGETALRQFTPADMQAKLAAMTAQSNPAAYVNGSWLTLDFDGGPSVDIQAAGVGPILENRGATVVMGLDLVQPGSRRVVSQSILRRTVFSTKGGVSFGRIFGDTLVTGEATITHQQRLQLESTQYLVALSVADTLSQKKDVPSRCRSMVVAMLGDPGAATPPVQVASAQ